MALKKGFYEQEAVVPLQPAIHVTRSDLVTTHDVKLVQPPEIDPIVLVAQKLRLVNKLVAIALVDGCAAVICAQIELQSEVV